MYVLMKSVWLRLGRVWQSLFSPSERSLTTEVYDAIKRRGPLDFGQIYATVIPPSEAALTAALDELIQEGVIDCWYEDGIETEPVYGLSTTF